jgi:ribonuclease E
MNHILINAQHEEEIRIGVVKDKSLINLNIETSLNRKTKGNIYYGKISRVEQSLEAAFVNYGKDKQGFLPFKEVSDLLKKGIKTTEGESLKISDVLKEGQEIIVQIEKEERGNKGASLTTNINIAGMYMIFNPVSGKSTGISRQISGKERTALREVVDTLKIPNNSGVIIRTAGSGKSSEELQWEVDYLNSLWGAITNACKQNDAPVLVYQESNIIVRTIRDYLREYTESIIIDNKQFFNQAYEFVRMVVPHHLDKIKYFDDEAHSLFEHMSVEKQARNIFQREVVLNNGATIVFDPTEALTAIDINSARSNKGANIEDTAYNANLSAAKEIAKQLQLRDIGGLVVIDFIDMNEQEHRDAIVNVVKQATAKDKARIQIGEISQFGLLEMSRQRVASSVIESVEKTCTTCNGRGTMPTVPNLALDILRKITKSCTTKTALYKTTVQASVDVITYLLNEKRHEINHLEEKYEIKITLLPNPYMQFPNWTIAYKNHNEKTGKKSPKSYERVNKPQNTLAENGLNDIPEEAIIRSFMPKTAKPQIKELTFFEKIKKALTPKKKPKKKQRNKKPYKKGNYKGKNKNNNRNKSNNSNNKPIKK